MATHLSCLGFEVTDRASLDSLLVRLASESDQLPCAEGVYLRWLSDAGPEMWLLYHREQGLVGFNPHFHGDSRVEAVKARAFERPNRTVLDGSLVVRTAEAGRTGAPQGADLVIDMPDYRVGGRLVGDEPVGLQITAFAHSIRTWGSADAYLASDDTGARLGIGSFVATGLAGDRMLDSNPDPESQAVLVGTVEASERLSNPVGGDFFWARVATDVGSFDVVTDPELLDQPIEPGAIIRGRFWLSGRVREYVEQRGQGLSVSVYRG